MPYFAFFFVYCIVPLLPSLVLQLDQEFVQLQNIKSRNQKRFKFGHYLLRACLLVKCCTAFRAPAIFGFLLWHLILVTCRRALAIWDWKAVLHSEKYNFSVKPSHQFSVEVHSVQVSIRGLGQEHGHHLTVSMRACCSYTAYTVVEIWRWVCADPLCSKESWVLVGWNTNMLTSRLIQSKVFTKTCIQLQSHICLKAIFLCLLWNWKEYPRRLFGAEDSWEVKITAVKCQS